MDTEPISSPSGTFWSRHKTALIIAGLGLTMLCAVGIPILAFVFLTAPSVTAEQEKLAQQGLANPDNAPLALGHYRDQSLWVNPREDDYTVQDGMVIMPDASRKPDNMGLPVLVYAPDGRDLAALPPPPTGNAVKTTDWFLIRCRAVPFRESWWGCNLMFGSWLE